MVRLLNTPIFSPGASVPFGMVRCICCVYTMANTRTRLKSLRTSQATRQLVGRPCGTLSSLFNAPISGYISDPTQKARGLSPLHDSGTGSSLGSYGNFEVMPLLCPGGFDTCTTRLTDRERYRKNDTDGNIRLPLFLVHLLSNHQMPTLAISL